MVGSLLVAALTTAASITPVAAQTENIPADRHNDDGFDKGLLGLLGLAGLLGLKRRDDRDARRNSGDPSDVNRSATSRV